MSFIFRGATALAVCFTTAAALAQTPGFAPQPNAAAYGSGVPMNPAAGFGPVQQSWNRMAQSNDPSMGQLWSNPAPPANNPAPAVPPRPTYGPPSAATPANPVYGQPVLRSFTPTPGGDVVAGPQPFNGSAMPNTAPTVPVGGDGGYGKVVMPIQNAPIYGSTPYHAMQQPCASPVIPVCPPVASNACPQWFGGVYGLIMDRDGEDEFSMLQSQFDPRLRYLDAREADMDTAGGVEARIGKTFCNCRWGLEGVYWGLFPDDEAANFYVPMPVADPMMMTMDLRDVYVDMFDAMGMPYRDTMDNVYHNTNYITAVHLRRSFEYHNVEINLLSGPLTPASCGCSSGCGPAGNGCGTYGQSGPTGSCGGGGWGSGYYGGECYGACHTACGPRPRLNVGWLFGVRFFKMDESLSMLVDAEDGIYGAGDPCLEFAYDVQTENNLVGVQLGMNLDYCLTKRLNMEVGSKFGFYGNHATSSQYLANGHGPAYVSSGGVDTNYDFQTSEDDIAYLGELRAGVGYKLNCHFRLTGGYRVVAASGVALPLDQIAYGRQFASPTAVNSINNHGQLVLHGAYAGLEFAW